MKAPPEIAQAFMMYINGLKDTEVMFILARAGLVTWPNSLAFPDVVTARGEKVLYDF